MKRLRELFGLFRRRRTTEPSTPSEQEQELMLRIQAGIALNKTPPR